MAIHVDPNKSARRTTSRLCFSQECPVIYRNFSGIIFLTIPGPFPTIPDHNTVRLTDNHSCEKTYINAFALTGRETHDGMRITKGAASLCPGLCAFALAGRTLIRDLHYTLLKNHEF